VLITAGRSDPIAPADLTEQLAAYFTAQGARAAIAWHEGGHEIRQNEVQAARDFLAANS
jgi:phospholipase/carboxylesterase